MIFFFLDIFWGPFQQGYALGCRGHEKGHLDLGVKAMGASGRKHGLGQVGKLLSMVSMAWWSDATVLGVAPAS